MNRDKVKHDIEKLKYINNHLNNFKVKSSVDHPYLKNEKDYSFLEMHIDQIYDDGSNGQDKLIKEKTKNIASKLSSEEIKIAKIVGKIASIDGYRFKIEKILIDTFVMNVGILISRQKTEDCFIVITHDIFCPYVKAFLKKYQKKNRICVELKKNNKDGSQDDVVSAMFFLAESILDLS